MTTSTIIVLAVIVVFVVWVISIYNGLISMRQRVNQAFADVDVQLKQRHDLIPNLVETVKGYAAHERGTLEEGRQGAQRGHLGARAGAAGGGREPAQRRVAPAVRAVRNPIPTSRPAPISSNYRQSWPISRTRSRRRAASSTNAVQEYNTGIQRFPAALFAGSLGFAPKDFFDLGEDRKTVGEAPQVKF